MLNKKAMAATAGGAEPIFVESVFSTTLYTGNDSTQTITNGIDLSGEGGLVWIKSRSQAYAHRLFDTNRGATKFLVSNDTLAEDTNASTLTAFTSSGFSVGASTAVGENGTTYASWTFRKAEKFFDVVTYSGTGSAKTVSHNLGSVPGCIIIKCTDNARNWIVYHRANTAAPQTDFLKLNDIDATQDLDTIWNDTAPTDTVFTVGSNTSVNETGYNYVAYLFAHDAGGFGEAGDQSVIKCGAFTTSSGAATVTLDWEPQWLLFKETSTTGNWRLIDNMRGATVGSDARALYANTTSAEFDLSPITPTATGFTCSGLLSAQDYIYIAIRRGPMKTPEAGTEVYAAAYGLSTSPVFVSGFPVDFVMEKTPASDGDWYQGSRLTGYQYMSSNKTNAEATGSAVRFDYMNGSISAFSGSTDYVGWNFRRAPGFFDVVCYTGNGSTQNINHNLGVAPELMIVKSRSNIQNWAVYSATVGNTGYLLLNGADAAVTGVSGNWNNTSPTSSVFTVGADNRTNNTSWTYVAYLFATVAGVSKVGSYTGTGTTLQVNCGFTNGSRFVLIKRTDSTGNWYVWDSTRGIVSGSDPFLLLNASNAETTGTDYIDTYSAGFEITSTAPAEINANGGSYIFLAIA